MVEIEVVEKERDVKGKYTRIIEEEWAIENLICSCILFKCQCLIWYMFLFMVNCYPIRFERLGAIGFNILVPIVPSSEFCKMKCGLVYYKTLSL